MLPKQHFERLCELAQAWGWKPQELAAKGLMEWLSNQEGEEGSRDPLICVRLPLGRYRVFEAMCGDEPISYLARFILCSVALHPEKYPELLAPIRPS